MNCNSYAWKMLQASNKLQNTKKTKEIPTGTGKFPIIFSILLELRYSSLLSLTRLSFVLCLNCLCLDLDLFSIEIFIYQYYYLE